MCEKNETCPQMMLYVMRGGEIYALLNSHGKLAKGHPEEKNPNCGIYRPTICCECGSQNFISLIENSRRELGDEATVRFVVPALREKKELGRTDKLWFVMTVPPDLVETARHPYYSGGLTYVSRQDLEEVVDVPPHGMAPINRNIIAMTPECRELVEAGFALLS
jgi:hypothetical protein